MKDDGTLEVLAGALAMVEGRILPPDYYTGEAHIVLSMLRDAGYDIIRRIDWVAPAPQRTTNVVPIRSRRK